MKNKLLLIILGLSLLIPLINAGVSYDNLQNIGTFKTDSPISIIVGCSNSSYLNFSRIEYQKNSTIVLGQEVSATEIGTSNIFNYTFSQRKDVGVYSVYGHCDLNGVDTPFEGYFKVTSSGEDTSSGGIILPAVLLACGAICLIIFFAFKNAHWQWRTFFIFLSAGMGLLSINAAKVFIGGSTLLKLIANVGIVIMVVLLSVIIVYFLIYSTIEILKVIKQKRGVRWDY